jgi:hypothetical protein
MSEEELIIEERDNAIDLLDRFVEVIEQKFNQEFGEHTSLNSPWRNALEFLEESEGL